MKHFIIGSRLFKTLFPDNERVQKRCKETADYDVLVESEPLDEVVKYFKEMYGTKTEVHCIPSLWAILIDEAQSGTQYLKNVYFTLKASHVYFHRQHFEKTIFDLYLMSGEGCVIIEPLFYELYDFWVKKFGEPWRPDFTKTSEEFFNDAVSRENVHDELHQLVSFFPEPAFKQLQEPNQDTVYVCPQKWAALDDFTKKRIIIEEAEVLALERDLIPGNMKNKQVAYQKWLKAEIDRIIPLWMSIYVIDNLFFFLNFNEDYGNFDYKTLK